MLSYKAIFQKIYFYFNLCWCFAWMNVCAPWALSPQWSPGRSIWSSGTGVTGRLPCECWRSNPGPPEEQPMLNLWAISLTPHIKVFSQAFIVCKNTWITLNFPKLMMRYAVIILILKEVGKLCTSFTQITSVCLFCWEMKNWISWVEGWSSSVSPKVSCVKI